MDIVTRKMRLLCDKIPTWYGHRIGNKLTLFPINKRSNAWIAWTFDDKGNKINYTDSDKNWAKIEYANGYGKVIECSSKSLFIDSDFELNLNNIKYTKQ